MSGDLFELDQEDAPRHQAELFPKAQPGRRELDAADALTIEVHQAVKAIIEENPTRYGVKGTAVFDIANAAGLAACGAFYDVKGLKEPERGP